MPAVDMYAPVQTSRIYCPSHSRDPSLSLRVGLEDRRRSGAEVTPLPMDWRGDLDGGKAAIRQARFPSPYGKIFKELEKKELFDLGLEMRALSIIEVQHDCFAWKHGSDVVWSGVG